MLIILLYINISINRNTQHMFDIYLGNVDKRTCQARNRCCAEAWGCVPSPSDFRFPFFLLKPASMSEIFTGALGSGMGPSPSRVILCSEGFKTRP